MYLPIGSVSLIFPACTNCRTDVAVNILFIDPMRKRVSSLFGTFFSRSAIPYAPLKSTLPFFARITVPAKRSATTSLSMRARNAAIKSASVMRAIGNSAGRGMPLMGKRTILYGSSASTTRVKRAN